MSQVIIENPIINSPFDEPTRASRARPAQARALLSPTLGHSSKPPYLVVQEPRGDAEFSRSFSDESFCFLGWNFLPAQGFGYELANMDVSLYEIVVARVHQKHVDRRSPIP